MSYPYESTETIKTVDWGSIPSHLRIDCPPSYTEWLEGNKYLVNNNRPNLRHKYLNITSSNPEHLLIYDPVTNSMTNSKTINREYQNLKFRCDVPVTFDQRSSNGPAHTILFKIQVNHIPVIERLKKFISDLADPDSWSGDGSPWNFASMIVIFCLSLSALICILLCVMKFREIWVKRKINDRALMKTIETEEELERMREAERLQTQMNLQQGNMDPDNFNKYYHNQNTNDHDNTILYGPEPTQTLNTLPTVNSPTLNSYKNLTLQNSSPNPVDPLSANLPGSLLTTPKIEGEPLMYDQIADDYNRRGSLQKILEVDENFGYFRGFDKVSTFSKILIFRSPSISPALFFHPNNNYNQISKSQPITSQFNTSQNNNINYNIQNSVNNYTLNMQSSHHPDNFEYSSDLDLVNKNFNFNQHSPPQVQNPKYNNTNNKNTITNDSPIKISTLNIGQNEFTSISNDRQLDFEVQADAIVASENSNSLTNHKPVVENPAKLRVVNDDSSLEQNNKNKNPQPTKRTRFKSSDVILNQNSFASMSLPHTQDTTLNFSHDMTGDSSYHYVKDPFDLSARSHLEPHLEHEQFEPSLKTNNYVEPQNFVQRDSYAAAVRNRNVHNNNSQRQIYNQFQLTLPRKNLSPTPVTPYNKNNNSYKTSSIPKNIHLQNLQSYQNHGNQINILPDNQNTENNNIPNSNLSNSTTSGLKTSLRQTMSSGYASNLNDREYVNTNGSMARSCSSRRNYEQRGLRSHI